MKTDSRRSKCSLLQLRMTWANRPGDPLTCTASWHGWWEKASMIDMYKHAFSQYSFLVTRIVRCFNIDQNWNMKEANQSTRTKQGTCELLCEGLNGMTYHLGKRTSRSCRQNNQGSETRRCCISLVPKEALANPLEPSLSFKMTNISTHLIKSGTTLQDRLTIYIHLPWSP